MKHIHSVYEWHKEQLWLQFLIISVCAIFINFFELHPLFEVAIYLISITKIVLSLKLMNVNPGSVNDQENFSWKYYQSLPVSKKDLYHLYLINHCFNFLPGMFWFICFHRPLAGLFEISPWELLRWVPLILLALFAFGLQSFAALVVYPRTQFSKINKRTLLYQNLRNSLYYVAAVMYAFLGFGVFVKLTYKEYPKLFKLIQDLEPYIWNKYLGIFTLIVLVVWMYRDNFRIWLDDKRRTPKANWKALRDVPLMTGVIILMIFPTTFLTTTNDGGPDLHEAVIENKLQTVKILLKNGENINLKNDYGYTPIMTAAGRGRGEIFDFLAKAGADQNQVTYKRQNFGLSDSDLFELSVFGGNISIVKKLFKPERVNIAFPDTGNSLLHSAVKRCHEEVIELLIENKANLNAVNKLGQTPLHLAASENCFPAAASLFEAGADPLIKDKKNKLAYEYGTRSKRSPASYIERKTLKRLPPK